MRKPNPKNEIKIPIVMCWGSEDYLMKTGSKKVEIKCGGKMQGKLAFIGDGNKK